MLTSQLDSLVDMYLTSQLYIMSKLLYAVLKARLNIVREHKKIKHFRFTSGPWRALVRELYRHRGQKQHVLVLYSDGYLQKNSSLKSWRFMLYMTHTWLIYVYFLWSQDTS